MPKPKRIYLVRHGESIANVDMSIYSHTPDYLIPLSPTGHLQAQAAGVALKEMLGEEKLGVYSSPFHRTRQTRSGIVAALRPGQTAFVREDPRLREQEYGNLRPRNEGEKIEAEQVAYGAFYYRIPNGESGADVFSRASSFISDLFRAFEAPDFPPNVVFVSHGLWIRLFLMRWFHWTPEQFARLQRPDNCKIITLSLRSCGRYLLDEPLALLPESEWPASAHDLDISPQLPAAADSLI